MMTTDDVMALIERKLLEERVSGYLQGCPLDEQAEFLRSHGVAAEAGWGPDRLRQEICNVICAAADAQLAAAMHG